MIKDVEITRVSFPEGDFEYVWCLLSMGDESLSFEAFIGVGISIDNWESASAKCRSFDENVLSYAKDWDEFESMVLNGGHDFSILDYERVSND